MVLVIPIYQLANALIQPVVALGTVIALAEQSAARPLVTWVQGKHVVVIADPHFAGEATQVFKSLVYPP